MASREQAVSLLSAANNHGDLAVKVSSLKQAKDILLSVEPALAAELFPYLVELQYSPEPLVRKMLLEIIEEIGWKGIEHLPVLVPIVVSFLGDTDHKIVRQSIIIGTHLFCGVLEEMVVQFHRRSKVEWWLDELWTWLLRFKESVFAIALKPGSVGTRLHALKFLETYVLLFSMEPNNSELPVAEGRRQVFNISWLVGGHPLLDPVMLKADANRTLGIFLNFLRSPGSLPGSLTIAVVNCLAAIARKRPIHYDTILSALFEFDPNLHIAKGCHAASIHYSLRTAFLGFLRCTYPDILETREKLIRALRVMNAGDAADQVIRQVDKMIKNNERASREVRFGRDDQLSNQTVAPGDQSRKRYAPVDDELDNGYGVNTKRSRYVADPPLNKPIKVIDSGQDCVSINGTSANIPVLDSDLTPAEKMIAMIGALLAEGERGAESLELLVSTIHPDLLADIVIVNMKHLPKVLPPVTRPENLSVSYHPGPVSSQTQVAPFSQTNAVLPVPPAQALHPAASTTFSSVSDISAANQFSMEPKRDPRRDPRRLDPRRVPTPAGLTSEPVTDESGAKQFDADGSAPFSAPSSISAALHSDSVSTPLSSNSKSDDKSIDPLASKTDEANLNYEVSGATEEKFSTWDISASSDRINSPLQPEIEDFPSQKLDPETNDAKQTDEEYDEPHLSPPVESASATEDTNQELPELPLYVEMTGEQRKIVGELAIERIIESYNHLPGTTCNQIRITLLSRLIALNNSEDDVVSMLQKHIVIDYSQRKGHELVMHVLYQLYSLTVQDSVDIFPDAAVAYEKFLLAVAKSLLDTFPASDKSFSKLLGEVPVLLESVFKLLDDLCYSDVVDFQGKEVRDSERVTQGLGAVWGLILGRPNNRTRCLDIVLKCAVHSQDEIRAKAIRLVANKLYQLDYVLENIENFATDMLLTAVNQHSSETELSQSSSVDQREGEVVNQEASVSGSQVLETGNGETVLTAGVQPVGQSTAAMSFSEAQRHISLFFALCTKKPTLLQLVFDVYGRAPKSVKQVIHRHVPIVVRSLGSSFSELLHIMADPPEGCENLLMLILQILTQETTPSTDLIATVKRLFETKLKDAMILIPILSSLSKDEVLPVFPRLVSLPIEKFQMALAHILQGSAHTGPALTPAEVLVAIHDISPEKDGLALKKITDACTACFEQRTVFTQQVLAKALNQMVDQTPLPLLFMRTVIQAIDAFPSLVDFVMEVLSKLVNRQVWKMPKLWVGFLKCVSQTRPRSFPVLLQLPSVQLDSALNKHSNLRGPLSSYASQPSVKASIPRQTLAVLGLDNGTHAQQPHVLPLNPSNASTAAQGANLT